MPRLAARLPSGAQLPDSQALGIGLLLAVSSTADSSLRLLLSELQLVMRLGVDLHIASGAEKTSRRDKIRCEVLRARRHTCKQDCISGHAERCANDQREESFRIPVRQDSTDGVNQRSPEVDRNNQVLCLYRRVSEPIFDNNRQERAETSGTGLAQCHQTQVRRFCFSP